MTDFSMLDKDHPERFHPTETDLDEARDRLKTFALSQLVGRPSMSVSTRLEQVNAAIKGLLYFDPTKNEYMLPEGEGFCPRCQLPLSQCCCKERGV